MSLFGAGEAVNGAHQVRKRCEAAASFEVCPVQNRRKAHQLSAVFRSGSGDQTIDPLHGVFEFGAAAVDTGNAGRDEQTVPQQIVAERTLSDGPRYSCFFAASSASFSRAPFSMFVIA